MTDGTLGPGRAMMAADLERPLSDRGRGAAHAQFSASCVPQNWRPDGGNRYDPL